MTIYNITTQVSWSIHDEWKKWMLDIRVPQMLELGIFHQHQLVRLLETDEAEGPTYALQLYVDENSSINDFKMQHQQTFDREEKRLWGDQLFSFTSLMEVIN